MNKLKIRLVGQPSDKPITLTIKQGKRQNPNQFMWRVKAVALRRGYIPCGIRQQ